jgi:hypothetical protein
MGIFKIRDQYNGNQRKFLSKISLRVLLGIRRGSLSEGIRFPVFSPGASEKGDYCLSMGVRPTIYGAIDRGPGVLDLSFWDLCADHADPKSNYHYNLASAKDLKLPWN